MAFKRFDQSIAISGRKLSVDRLGNISNSVYGDNVESLRKQNYLTGSLNCSPVWDNLNIFFDPSYTSVSDNNERGCS